MANDAETFRALHHGPTPLVLPNAWDPVSARIVAEAGYLAIATSSGAVARVIGYDDGQLTPPAEMFGAIARIARAVDVPVTADVEAGYGLDPKELVERLLDAGAVACNGGPLNAHAAPGGPTAAELVESGATRISYGTSLHNHAMAVLRELLPGLGS